jgi:hypothetical protein
MKKFNRVLFTSIGILVIFLAFIQECESQTKRPRRDGLWWVELNPQLKKEIIIGYYTGAILGFDLVKDKFKKNDPCLVDIAQAAKKIQSGLLEIDPFHLAAVVDSIYTADSTNLGLMFFHSVWIAANHITLNDNIRVQKMCDQFKKEDCFKFKSVQELRTYQLPY